MKRFLLSFVLLVFCIAAFAQAVKYKKSASGMQYIIHNANKGAKVKVDDVVFLHLKYSTAKDSLLFDSWTMGGPLQIKVTPPAFKNDLMDGLMMLTAGDSATFLINADSLFAKTFAAEMPDIIAKGSDLKFTVKINQVTNEAAMKVEESKVQKVKDMEEKEAIEKYIKDNNLTPQKTPSGLMYVMLQEGKGTQAQAGRTVRVHYTGKLLNGTKFDSSLDRNDPLEFQLGKGMVIKGWDEGIALLKEGGKALLIIPSNLGYGSRGAGGSIAPFTPLTFEVELVGVQ